VQDLSETGFTHSPLLTEGLDEKVNLTGDSPLDLSTPVSGIFPGFAPESIYTKPFYVYQFPGMDESTPLS
jgi:hypothetical protein